MVTGLARISVATMIRRMALNEDASGSSSRTALKPMSNATMRTRCAWDSGRRRRQMRLDVGQVRTMGLEPGRGLHWFHVHSPPYRLFKTPPVRPSSLRLVVMHLITSILFW